MTRRLLAHRPDLLAGAAYLALAYLFLWPLFAAKPADRALIGPPDGDFVRQFYPYRVLVARQWAEGTAPFWNPHQSAGAPAWADPQYAVLYPWRLAQAPLALGGRTLPLWAVELEVLVHLALAGLGVFALLRGLGSRDPAAFFSGGLFAFGGFLTGYPVEQLAVLDSFAWLPWMLVALTASIRRRRDGEILAARRAAIAAGLATALALLAGHPQSVLYGLYLGLALLGWMAWTTRRAGPWDIPVLWLASFAGLSAAQWWPSYAFTQVASRQLDPAELLAGLDPGDIVQLVAPGVVTQYAPLYIGVIGLLLALVAMAKDRLARFWGTVAAIAWLVALGGHGPLLPLLLRIAPGFALFRHHERAAGVVSLALAVGAGLGLDYVMRHHASRGEPSGGSSPNRLPLPRLTLILAGLLASGGLVATVRLSAAAGDLGHLADALTFGALILGLWAGALAAARTGRIGHRALGWAAIALALIELFSFNRKAVLRPFVPVFQPDAIVAYLLEHAGTRRISSEGLLPGGPNAATVYGLVDVNGDSPLQYAGLTKMMTGTQEVEWLKVLDVHFVVTKRDIPVGYPLTQVFADGDRRVYAVDRSRLPAGLPDHPDWWFETYGIISATTGGLVAMLATAIVCLGLWRPWAARDGKGGAPPLYPS